MTSHRTAQLEGNRMMTLTKREIDRRIEDVIREVTAQAAAGAGGPAGEDLPRPRRIEAADLVRRFRPFLVYN